ncbi:MAG: M23 family metallopeptidase [Alphaproteobacteria bacterium]
MKFKAIYLIFSLCLISSVSYANESSIQICGKRAQGQILSGIATNIETLSVDGRKIDIASNGKFIFAFERDDKLNHKISATDFNGETQIYDFPISATKWDIQNIKGIEPKKVEPSQKEVKEIERERKAIRNAMTEDREEIFWQNKIEMPLKGRTSGNYGGQRIMNGKKMNPHQGMDIAAPKGTPVKAPNDGIITLSGKNNFFYSGNVVIIDHGYKLFTIYAHLTDTKMKVGDKVKKGDVIGTVGTTGRSTGPHLHWGASHDGIRFDPNSLNYKDDYCSFL